MKRMTFLLALGLALAAVSAAAQPSSTSADLPSQPGDWYRTYVNTSGMAVAALIGPKGGPQRWDFSYARAEADRVQRTDIVAASDGGHGGSFPAATYAERVTREGSNVRSWSYYSIATGQGRLYHGFYDPVSNEADPITKFDAPTLELPDASFGSAWERAVTFEDTIQIGFEQWPILVQFKSQASVDAWGTLALPEIGEVPTLRVNEVNTYVVTETSMGLPFGSYHVRNYFWLVKGIGKAVHILSKAEASIPPENFNESTNVFRVFQSSAVAPEPKLEPVANLRATLKGDEIFLSWDKPAAVPATASYVVQVATSLAVPDAWSGLVTNRDNFLFDPIPKVAGQRFYRVFATPAPGSSP